MQRLLDRMVRTSCLVGALAVVGCTDEALEDGANTSSITRDLAVLGRVYHDHHDRHNQGPAGWDEAIQFATEHQHDVAALERVRAAGYQVQWGKRFSDITGGVTNTVLAEAGSGPKLMFDGYVLVD